ncbi:hypothetical protein QQ045_023102 [Rhodiola kirilowii]
MFIGLACWWKSFSQKMSSFGAVRFVSNLLMQLLIAALTCIFAVVGAVVGCITGAVIGQTTETGFLRGCGVGTIAGSLAALEFAESVINHNFFSKVRLSSGPTEGEAFADWLTAVLLKAYDFQVNNLQEHSGMSDLSDIFDIETGTKGLSLEHISNLPEFKVQSRLNESDEDDEVTCPICLEDLREGECAKRLRGCRHEYHSNCIDAWLVRRGSCPVCRQNIAE